MKYRAVPSWLRLIRVFQRVDHASQQFLRSWDLSVAQFDVIAHVGAAEGMTQQSLADRLLVSKGNVCQLLDKLERARLIERREDGRANRLYLTDAGHALFRQVVPAHEELIADRFAVLSAQEQVHLHTLLRKLDRGLSERRLPAQATAANTNDSPNGD
jgi:DNA-binding MarR family transcriptional regulator